jgi:hypothetical protein
LSGFCAQLCMLWLCAACVLGCVLGRCVTSLSGCSDPCLGLRALRLLLLPRLPRPPPRLLLPHPPRKQLRNSLRSFQPRCWPPLRRTSRLCLQVRQLGFVLRGRGGWRTECHQKCACLFATEHTTCIILTGQSSQPTHTAGTDNLQATTPTFETNTRLFEIDK